MSLDLAAIGNCNVAALITPEGRNVWFCFPRLDGDPLFHALLGGDDPQRGFMDVVLRDQVETRQRYVTNTAVVETVLCDRQDSRVRITDLAPRFRRFGRIYRPPALLRRIVPEKGNPRIAVRIRPGMAYGGFTPQISLGSNHIRYNGPTDVVRLTTDMPISYALHETEFVLDRPITLWLGPDEPLPENPDANARHVLTETIAYWEDWVRGLNIPFDWQEAVIRAAITLKLCSYEDTGAIVAALTTSIPEAPGTERNWDYRFCWIRDAFHTVGALNRLSATRTMEDFVRFIVNTVLREQGGPVAPLYPIGPGFDMSEVTAAALPGYGGQGPVRIGNAAASQEQNDSYGSIVLTATQMFADARLPRAGSVSLYQHLEPTGRTALALACEPDAGLWEFRGRRRVHTHSAAMCWAAVDRLAMIARRVGLEDDAAEWASQADRLQRTILDAALVPGEGWLSGVFGEPVVDASSFLLPELGMLRATDPRFLKTLDVLEKRLVRQGHVMRYDEADDFGMPETAFLVCSFWYFEALASVGRRDEAREYFEQALGWRNHLGLLSEDRDPKTGRLWGNFPQTYSQVGLIRTAMRLSRSWEEGLWRAG